MSVVQGGGAYVAYEEMRSPKLGAGLARCYWQGAGSNRWGAGDRGRTSAERFADQRQAREAVAAEYPEMVGRVGYEWVPAVVEQLELLEVPAGQQLALPFEGAGR